MDLILPYLPSGPTQTSHVATLPVVPPSLALYLSLQSEKKKGKGNSRSQKSGDSGQFHKISGLCGLQLFHFLYIKLAVNFKLRPVLESRDSW